MSYSGCRIELKQSGAAYPRSCPKCKFGPCTKVQELDYKMSRKIDFFVEELKIKLLKSQKAGRSGWDEKAWAEKYAARELLKHIAKGDPLDVAAFAFFLSYHNLRTWPAE